MITALTTPDAGTDPAETRTARVSDVDRTLAELKRVQKSVSRSHTATVEHARDRARLVEKMRLDHGWSYRRIAAELGISHNALVHSANRSVSGGVR